MVAGVYGNEAPNKSEPVLCCSWAMGQLGRAELDGQILGSLIHYISFFPELLEKALFPCFLN